MLALPLAEECLTGEGMDTRRRVSSVLTASGMLALALSANALAHPGGLDKQGCHTNRKTGEYHCHRGAPAAPRYVDTPRSSFAPRPRAVPVFANCAEARAAGAAPVRRGDPGYGPHLDRDNDGVGCEPYRGRR